MGAGGGATGGGGGAGLGENLAKKLGGLGGGGGAAGGGFGFAPKEKEKGGGLGGGGAAAPFLGAGFFLPSCASTAGERAHSPALRTATFLRQGMGREEGWGGGGVAWEVVVGVAERVRRSRGAVGV